jgi:hypothetical protein
MQLIMQEVKSKMVDLEADGESGILVRDCSREEVLTVSETVHVEFALSDGFRLNSVWHGTFRIVCMFKWRMKKNLPFEGPV